jgi:hypothetical protein
MVMLSEFYQPMKMRTAGPANTEVLHLAKDVIVKHPPNPYNGET